MLSESFFQLDLTSGSLEAEGCVTCKLRSKSDILFPLCGPLGRSATRKPVNYVGRMRYSSIK